MNYFTNIKKSRAIILGACLCACLFSGCIGSMAPKKTQKYSLKNEEPVKIRNTTWNTENLKPNYLALAEDLMAKGFYGVALVQLDLAMEQDKNNSKIYNLMGVCARETEDLKRAAIFLKKAMDLDQKNASAFNNIAILYSMKKNFDLAEKNFTRALALDPGRAIFFNNAGTLYMKKKEYEKAKKNFNRAMALEPGHINAINNLAITLGYLKEYDRAMKLLLTHQTYKTACYNMGCIYEITGENKKANKMFALAKEDQTPFNTQVLNPEAPLDTSPPTGITGEAGNAVYRRYQDKLSNQSD